MNIYGGKIHPIIKNENTYFLNKKVVTFHSEDRDIKKWPNSNEFEISLPESLQDVQSMRLLSIKLDDSLPVFSNKYRNTKLTFAINESLDTLANFVKYTITIDEGTYTPETLALTIENLMNNKTIDIAATFKCDYNKVTKKMIFSCNLEFKLMFNINENYNDTCNEYGIRQNTSKWGLPYLLGYERKEYESIQLSGDDIYFNYDGTAPIINSGEHYVDIRDVNPINISGENCFYMEVDKYNIIDEILPDSHKKNTLSVNNGKINSAFAQIPLKPSLYEQIFECKNNYNPPIKDISKLKFKFRFHDGRLVDFKNINFSFMIQFNSLIGEQRRNADVRAGTML